jgi:hypothetical protein
MDLVELGARSMDLVDLEFLELGCLAEKNGVELFFGSEAAWSSPKHALNLILSPGKKITHTSVCAPLTSLCCAVHGVHR